MSDTKLRVPRATDLLKSDHEKVRTLFAEYEEFGDDSALTKQGIYEQILRELAVHGRIEEDLFYPAIAALGEVEADLIEKALEEHQIVKTLLSEISMFVPNGEAFDGAMNSLKEIVDLHVQEEEQRLFPLFERLSADRRKELSEALSKQKAELSEGTTGLE